MAATYSSLVGLAVGGKYEIRRVMGAGGMGVVCEAVHVDIGKKVAIKLIDKSMKESDLIVQRFRVEAKAAGRIQSEHIVGIHDVGVDPRVGLYMIMEHLVGEDLQTRLERDRRLDVKLGVMLAHQIARGLAKAHEAGVVHRDLKPANVFLTQRDNGQMLVKLLDFGVSKVLADESSGRITGAGAPIGTPLYMSPEQAEGKDDTDGRADIWSLGALMYEALSGAPPFQDRGSYHGTIVGILTSRPKLLQDAAPWVPAALASVIDDMLVHDRDARIKDAATVTQRLLEAYPAVLPDGTGRHTAVIVPKTSAAVDTTGDTEFFTSADLSAAQRGRTTGPGVDSARNSKPAGEDSGRTVPNVTTGGGASRDGTRTGAATPVEMVGRERDHDEDRESPVPESMPITSGIPQRGPRTDPMPWGGASSSASGVAMPGTPPVIDPLPPSQIAPDTMRDDALAVRAHRRRWIRFAAVAVVVASGALGGYYAGRKANATSTAAARLAATATATATATASATATATAKATATTMAGGAVTTGGAGAAPSAAVSAAPEPSASTARRPMRRIRMAPRPSGSEGAKEGPPNDSPPQNPYEAQPPASAPPPAPVPPPAPSGAIDHNAPF